MSRSRLPLLLLTALGTATAGTPHGILSGDLDPNAQACTDFFAYANGTWRRENPIPADMDRWSRRWQSGEANKAHVRDLLDALAAGKTKASGPGRLAGDYYAACMDEGRIDAQGLAPLKPWLDGVESVRTRDALQAELGRLHNIGVMAPFFVYAQQGLHAPDRMVANVSPGRLGMPDRDYYLKPDKRFAEARTRYLAHVGTMFALAGAKPAEAKAAAKTVFDFEKRLAAAALDNVALRDPKQQDHPMAFAALQAKAPSLDWGRYFDTAGMARGEVNVTEPAFLAQLDRELATTPLATWRTYLRWQVLHANAEALPTAFVAENFDFYGRYLSGAKQMKPRWNRCAADVDEQLGDALGQAYVAKYFPPEAKARMEGMVANILLAMGDSIRELDWMAPETKARALEKLGTFRPKIGYPSKWKAYAGVDVSRDAFLSSRMSTTRWNVAENRHQAGKPVDRDRWEMTPPTSNAYYNPSLNEIVFPAGILQPPAFDVDATDAVNYGAIGVVIGHEISHGFDDQGAQFDAKGRLANWWTPADLTQFKAKGQCVVDQFERYAIEPGLHHNGRLVLGESIGDLAGAKIALRAYRKSREGKGPEPTIDGFTPEQQFFIAWGQWRGDETRPETQRSMIQGDPHPVARFRVNGPLSNLPEFREAFACKAGDAMVRAGADRCEVW
ncbi:M13 family metallopeptidase [Lysobacter xanthus]